MPFPVDIKYVNEAERKLGIRFPPAVVNHLVKENGGSVRTEPDEWQLYPILDSSDRKRLSRTCNDIVRETMQCRSAQSFPQSAVAIGANGGGDHLVLLPSKTVPGYLDHAVWWWDHETGTVHRVADDFSELE